MTVLAMHEAGPNAVVRLLNALPLQRLASLYISGVCPDWADTDDELDDDDPPVQAAIQLPAEAPPLTRLAFGDYDSISELRSQLWPLVVAAVAQQAGSSTAAAAPAASGDRHHTSDSWRLALVCEGVEYSLSPGDIWQQRLPPWGHDALAAASRGCMVSARFGEAVLELGGEVPRNNIYTVNSAIIW